MGTKRDECGGGREGGAEGWLGMPWAGGAWWGRTVLWVGKGIKRIGKGEEVWGTVKQRGMGGNRRGIFFLSNITFYYGDTKTRGIWGKGRHVSAGERNRGCGRRLEGNLWSNSKCCVDIKLHIAKTVAVRGWVMEGSRKATDRTRKGVKGRGNGESEEEAKGRFKRASVSSVNFHYTYQSAFLSQVTFRWKQMINLH